MSETKLTHGWASPAGRCDICNKKPATRWFGDTGVALCDSQYCAQVNQERWEQMIEDTKKDENRDY